ncbi:hypothetical protein EVAR_22586_1 [Eumeta japonica]|uniref:Uncharacterized protein n=1 Tax=Eumeta variegata TaxID=151549 RepID=A0A4C1U879_EUMVA|nr:hypothetical protein EVAR_22586_1 [Eumeta japonica]
MILLPNKEGKVIRYGGRRRAEAVNIDTTNGRAADAARPERPDAAEGALQSYWELQAAEKAVLAMDPTQFDLSSKNGPRHLVQCHAYQIQGKGAKCAVGHNMTKHEFTATTPRQSSNRQYRSIEMSQNQPKWRAGELLLSV